MSTLTRYTHTGYEQNMIALTDNADISGVQHDLWYKAVDVAAQSTEIERLRERVKELEDERHGPTVSYWQAIAEQAQAEAKQRLDDWCVLKEQAEAAEATVASQQLTIQGMIADGDILNARVEAFQSAMAEEMAENVKLFELLGVMPQLNEGTAGTDAVVRAVKDLQRQLAEAREAIEIGWGVIANVSGGDWELQPATWQEAARKWRDQFVHLAMPEPPRGGWG